MWIDKKNLFVWLREKKKNEEEEEEEGSKWQERHPRERKK